MTDVAHAEGAADAFDRVTGQDAAVRALRAAARAPVHAYLLVGTPGSGRRAAATAFAAALLCPTGGCGHCDTCRRVSSGSHPDLVVVEREGAAMTVADAREIRRLAMRTPNEAHRKMLVLPDFHLAVGAAAVLLKIVEEPPASTVFVILADHVPPELVTIASRCVVIHLAPLTDERVEAALVAEGVAPDVAARVAPSSGGRLDRARLLASDSDFDSRLQTWRSVPSRLDGTGAAVAVLANELVAMLSSAAVAPLEARHAAEVTELDRQVEQTGERGAGRKELADRHRRELKRLRTDELRFGLAVLAGAYRDALVATPAPNSSGGAAWVDSLSQIQAASEALARNPSEGLLLQALLLRLAAI